MTNFEKFIGSMDNAIGDFFDVVDWGGDDPEVIGERWCECRERIERARNLYIAEESIQRDIENSEKRSITIGDGFVTVETKYATCTIQI